MKILKYLLLIVLLCGGSTFILFVTDESTGSNASYLTYILLVGYYFFSKKRKPLFPFLLLGVAYYTISGYIYVEDPKFYINELIKYFILIVAGAELARNTTPTQFCTILLLGSLSILAQAVFIPDDFGRYSGFYLDPNGAGFVSLIGYCLSFSLKNKKIRLLFIFLFTFTGVITFSRFFLLMWMFISVIATIANKRNSQGLVVGFGALVLLLSVATILQVNTERFSIIENLFEEKVETSDFTEGSRTVQWSSYADVILTNPIFGNGYRQLSGTEYKQGVHNTYLLTIGEAGFIPFLILIGIYLYMCVKSIKFYKEETHLPLIAISVLGILMVVHNFYNYEFILFTSIWLYTRVTDPRVDDELTSSDEPTGLIEEEQI